MAKSNKKTDTFAMNIRTYNEELRREFTSAANAAGSNASEVIVKLMREFIESQPQKQAE